MKEGIIMNDTTALLPHVKLRFNIDHPSYEECYLFGYECGLSEVEEGANPFQVESSEAEQWLEGWWAGVYGEQPLFDMNQLEEEKASEIDAANDKEYHKKHSFMSLVLEISGAIAASALVGYQLFELVA
jgi:ribosome modulation factor